ncbi:MAG: molybdopterin-guanine dinucleotide biosynthesis protein MobB [Gemmatimonadetes bacterium]|nr:molybdopterin-guanine dinucleotide biosynthesis protein MobB [Gemmatimonadota bacterium]
MGGRRIIDRVADALRDATDEPLVVANDARAPDWLPGVRVAGDLRPGEGSLGGLHAALAHARGAVIVVAWDMPFVSTALLRRLRALGESGFDAALPESGSKRGVEPMCAWYAPPCLDAITAALDRGDRRVIAFFDAGTCRSPQCRRGGDVRRPGDVVPEREHGPGTGRGGTVRARSRTTQRRNGRTTPEPLAPLPAAALVAAVDSFHCRNRTVHQYHRNHALPHPRMPPLLSIVGRKHSGKTTLVVRLAAELRRRGVCVMTIKHGSHTFNLDPAITGTDRHFPRGRSRAGGDDLPDRFALVMRWSEELTPHEVAARFMSDADPVLCEGFKESSIPSSRWCAARHTPRRSPRRGRSTWPRCWRWSPTRRHRSRAGDASTSGRRRGSSSSRPSCRSGSPRRSADATHTDAPPAPIAHVLASLPTRPRRPRRGRPRRSCRLRPPGDGDVASPATVACRRPGAPDGRLDGRRPQVSQRAVGDPRR